MEKQYLYQLADYFFFLFHVTLILFNLFGWLSRRWRKLNLITLGLTAFSWFVLGMFYGFGYCMLTDWHWQVREKLGYAIYSNSYIHFLITELTGLSIDENFVDVCTAVLFFAALGLSLFYNIRDARRRRKPAES